jgi:O-antigen/teichoic acid export membrane protein
MQENKIVKDILLPLKNKSFESFVWRVFSMLVLFMMHVVAGRILSPDNYGLFSFVLSIVSIFVLVANMGWTTALMKLVPHYIHDENWSMLKGVLFRSHQMSLSLSVFFSMVLLVLSYFIPNPDKSTAFYFSSWLLPIMTLTRLRQVVFQGLYHVRGSILPDEIITPILMVLGLYFLRSKDIHSVISMYLVILVLIFGITAFWLWTLLPGKMKSVSAEYRTESWIKLSVSFLIGGLSQVFLNQCGVFLLGMHGMMKETGLFSVAFRLALFITFAMTSLNVIGMPMMSAHYNDHDIESVRMIHKKTQMWSIMGGLPIFLVLIFFPEKILSIFGTGFEAASLTLRILSFGQLSNISVGLAGSLLSVAGAERYNMAYMVSALVICLVLMFFTLPAFGAVGAACSYSAGMFFLSVMQLYRANKILKKKI